MDDLNPEEIAAAQAECERMHLLWLAAGGMHVGAAFDFNDLRWDEWAIHWGGDPYLVHLDTRKTWRYVDGEWHGPF